MVRAIYISLIATFLVQAQNPATTVTVDAAANRHAINPNIYGVAYGDGTTLPDLNVPINRYGGNNASRYNWKINADNRGSDWYFESIGETSSTAGERGDTFFSMSRNAGAQSMLTIPMIGWVAKLAANRNKLSSFSIAKYGPQTGNDWQWFADAGNGIHSSNGQDVTGNDPNDANVPADSAFQQGWIQHLVNAWGKSANGGVGYYLLDNESSIWFSTHRDVHPVGPTMDEIKNAIVDYAAKIKAVDSTAKVVGPEEWGWSGYLLSGYDQQWGNLHGWSNLPDRTNHGGQDYLPWLLSQLKQTRSLDVFSVHYYPQGGEFGNDTSTAMQLRRNRSTRSLWDPNYIDESWIGDKVQLIPRIRSWANTYYFSGAPVAITEYNWGGEAHINGATTQADILGIFGREGLDLAARWTTPDSSTPTYKAIKMYRNYDGNKSTFGDASVAAAVVNPDNLSAFAALRSSDGALTVMLINKVLSGNTPVTLALNNFSGNGVVHVYQLTGSNSIQQLSDVSYSGASLNLTVGSQSITLLIVPTSGGLPPPASLSIGKTHSGTFTQGQQSATYTVTVSNANGAGPTSGSVTVTETAPPGLTLMSMAGGGWTCVTNTCSRNDALNGGLSYPAITVTVNVTPSATSPQVNQVSVSGGGSASANASDSTTINPLVTQPLVTKPGIFRQGFLWVLDANGNHAIDSSAPGQDYIFGFGGLAGDIPVFGDWNGDGHTKVGYVRNGNRWHLDFNGDRSVDRQYTFGGLPGDIPVVGDWTGDGKSKIGVYRGGVWILDLNGNGIEDPAEDTAAFGFGGFAGDVPVVGDWAGSGKSNVGIFRQGFLWVLDINGNHTNGAVFPYGGIASDRPVVGDWAGTGVTQVGIFRQGFLWVLDANGNRLMDDGSSFIFAFGGYPGPPPDLPVAGKW